MSIPKNMASSRSGICFRISVSHVGSPARTTNIRRKRNRARIIPSAMKIADSREIFLLFFLQFFSGDPEASGSRPEIRRNYKAW